MTECIRALLVTNNTMLGGKVNVVKANDAKAANPAADTSALEAEIN